MRSVFHPPSSDQDRALLRRRATGLVLALLAHALVVLLLLRLTPPSAVSRSAAGQSAPMTFDLMPDRQSTPDAAPREAKVTKAKQQQKIVARKLPAPTAAKAAVAPPIDPFKILPVDLAAADIGKLPRRADAAKGGGSSAGAGQGSGSAYGPGEGPGGHSLYNAEWYREPTQGELALYLPPDGPPIGWGMIACRTIADYHVDNCQTIGESPLGSGLSRAIRRAAWQFRVRPPRVDGRPVIGAWVRIRIEFTEAGADFHP